ncbi:malonyl-ACP O-methyltransferase BioC [Denitratimonas sp. CY0512]|uniref:malonyl-ACP O-methyltransferase BioC n=1 Tax=Denitratimonas sp. CY0512 TaxID=3131940 RepID=UPI0030B268A3
MFDLDFQHVRRAFGRAAPGYAAVAVLQREVEKRLLEHLDYVTTPPQRILDIGCGPGFASAALKARWPRAQVIALDLALPMLRQAGKQAGWWRPRFSRICADARALPLAPGSIDLVFSNLCMQWIPDLPALLTQWRQVLAPGGFLACSTFGPDTLHELRAAFAQVDETPHVNGFAPIQALGDGLMSAGFRDPVLDTDHFTLTYASATGLMRELRAIGAGNAASARRRSLTGKARMAAVIEAYDAFRQPDGRLPATWEVIYAHAFAPEPGQPLRSGGLDVAAVPLSRIPIRRRSH